MNKTGSVSTYIGTHIPVEGDRNQSNREKFIEFLIVAISRKRNTMVGEKV